MAPPNGIVSFDALGARRNLQLTINAICLLEDQTKKSAVEIATELHSNPHLNTIRAIFWAGLGDKSLTLTQAGDILQDVGVAKAVAYAREALMAAFPDQEDGASGEDTRPPDAADG